MVPQLGGVCYLNHQPVVDEAPVGVQRLPHLIQIVHITAFLELPSVHGKVGPPGRSHRELWDQ